MAGVNRKGRLTRQAEEQEKRRSQEEEEQIRESCTFAPAITPTAKTIYSAIDEQQRGVVNRLTQYHPHKLEVEKQKSVQRIVEEEMADCTFQPRTNSRHPTGAVNCHSRLYKDAVQRKQHREWWAEWWAGVPLSPASKSRASIDLSPTHSHH